MNQSNLQNALPLKSLSLIALTLQNSLLTILLHQSRTLPNDQLYSAPLAVFLSEVLKSIISFIIPIIQSARTNLKESNSFNKPSDRSIHCDENNGSDSFCSFDNTYLPYRGISSKNKSKLSSIIINQVKLNISSIFSPDCWKLSIPAVLYVIQNNLQFVAASHLDMATFSVTYQLKILTTALCSVIILRRRLSLIKWMSLLFLAIGVGLVQLENVPGAENQPGVKRLDQANLDRTLGFVAVLMACLTSGLAGVYFELVLKSSNKVDLWIRNVQLSLFSLPPALFTTIASSPSSGQPLMAHFGFWAWMTVLTQVLGGLVTALVIKFADNILKGFATSLSIILSTLVGVFMFSDPLSFGTTLGASIVLMSTYVYNLPSPEIVGAPSLATKQPTTKLSGTSNWKVETDSSHPFVIQFDCGDSINPDVDEKKDERSHVDFADDEELLRSHSTLISPSPKSSHFPLASPTRLNALLSPTASSNRNLSNHSSDPSCHHESKDI